MPMDPQSASGNPSTSSLDGLVQQILSSIESALASQMRTRLDSDHPEEAEEMLSKFSDYLSEVEEARRTSYNPQSDTGLIFDQSNLLSVHDLLKSFLDLDHSGLSLDYVGVIRQLSVCYSRIEEILAGSGHESDAAPGPQVSRSPSPVSPSPDSLAGVGVWSQSPWNYDASQDEIDNTDDDQTYFSTSFNSDNSLYYSYAYTASISDLNEAHSSVAVEYSEMSEGEDES